jgi:hypothetical protein
MSGMASRATGGTFAAFLISGAILGFAGGAFLGTQADGSDNGGNNPNSSATAPADGGQTGGDASGSESPETGESPDASEEPAGDGAISLTAAQDTVAASERIDISGTIDPPEEGIQLQLQRSVDGGEFEDFPISPWETEADGSFGGYVQSSQAGENSFRVVRVDDDSVVSDEIVVTIG